MARRHRIAVVSPAGEALSVKLRALPDQPLVQSHVDIFDDVEALRRQQPHLLILAPDSPTEAHMGAARLLVSLVPGLVVLVLCRTAGEDMRRSCERHGFPLLVEPVSDHELRAAVAECLEGPRVGRNDGYVEFAHGICDEINNPLMLAAGHLQLLLQSLRSQESSGGNGAAGDLLPQVEAANSGLARIQRTMQKVQMLSRAARQNGKVQELRVAELARGLREDLAVHHVPVQVLLQQGARSARLLGDFDVLLTVLSCLAGVAHALGTGADELRLELGVAKAAEQPDEATGARQLTASILVPMVSLPEWELPRAFEPYYINRALVGSTHGLDLFLVRTVARAHGGDALAQRVGEGLGFLVRLGMLLPR